MKSPEEFAQQNLENLATMGITLLEPPKKYLEILKSPDLLERIDREFDKKIVRENKSRKVIFLVTNMRNVSNLNKATDNLIVNALSGTGKDHVSEGVFDILPNSEKEELNKATPKVLGYTRNKAIDDKATWIKTALRLEDATQSLINDESFKTFLSANSNRINKGKTVHKGKVLDICIEGKPSIILTVADAEINNEGLRRLPMLFLDEGIDQTKEILKRQAKFAKEGLSSDYDTDLKIALRFLKRVPVVIPFADKLPSIFEKSLENVIVRTAFPRFLDYIKSSASLFQYQREKDSKGNIIATKEDYENGILCLQKTTSNLMMIPLSKLDKNLFDLFVEEKLQNQSIDELMDKHEIQRLGKGDRWIRSRLDFLVSRNFLKRISVKEEHSFKPINKYSYSAINEFYFPDWEQLTIDTELDEEFK